MPSGLRSDGAIGNTTYLVEPNLPTLTAVAVALPRHSAKELQPIDVNIVTATRHALSRRR